MKSRGSCSVDFDNHLVVDNQIESVTPDFDAAIYDSDRILAGDSMPTVLELEVERLGVDAFDEAEAQRVVHGEGCADD